LLCFALVESSEQIITAETLRAAAQVLLTECLTVFKQAPPEKQTIMIKNFYQLAMIAMMKKERTDFLFLTRSTLFCCISMEKGCEQVHEIALKLIFLFINMVEKESPDFGNSMRQIARTYFEGLEIEEQNNLRGTSPRIMTRIDAIQDQQSFFGGGTEYLSSQSIYHTLSAPT
jgi:hypothetical protein